MRFIYQPQKSVENSFHCPFSVLMKPNDRAHPPKSVSFLVRSIDLLDFYSIENTLLG